MNNYSRKICVLCDKPLNDLTSELNQPKISKGSTSLNSIEMLEKLAQLHERGILTDEEFFKKKEDILGKM